MLDAILEKWKKPQKKIKFYPWSKKWHQSLATIVVAINPKSLATAIDFNLMFQHRKAKSVSKIKQPLGNPVQGYLLPKHSCYCPIAAALG